MPMSKKDYVKKKCKCNACCTGNPYGCRRGDHWLDRHRWRLGQKKFGTQLEQLKEFKNEKLGLF